MLCPCSEFTESQLLEESRMARAHLPPRMPLRMEPHGLVFSHINTLKNVCLFILFISRSLLDR